MQPRTEAGPYLVSTDIAAPAEQVWAVLADVLRWPQWLPTVTAVQPLGAPALAEGARFRIVQPRLSPAVWSVVAVSPRSHFDWESRKPGLRVLATHEIRPVSAEVTHLRLGLGFSGPLAGLARLVAGRLSRQYLEREAAALKQRAEGA